MSYVVDKFDAGEVKFKDGAVGWLMDDGEFRPLMEDAVQELNGHGLISAACMRTTKVARENYAAAALLSYAKNYTGPSEEERAEARAAFGPGETLVNVVTGHKWRT